MATPGDIPLSSFRREPIHGLQIRTSLAITLGFIDDTYLLSRSGLSCLFCSLISKLSPGTSRAVSDLLCTAKLRCIRCSETNRYMFTHYDSRQRQRSNIMSSGISCYAHLGWPPSLLPPYWWQHEPIELNIS